MEAWQLQEAKARLSELIKQVLKEGPQTITMRGEPTAVVISKAEYDRLRQPRGSFVEFMRKSPLYGVDIEVKRERVSSRKAPKSYELFD